MQFICDIQVSIHFYPVEKKTKLTIQSLCVKMIRDTPV